MTNEELVKYLNLHKLSKDKINKIMWKNNFGYDKPVVCEHVALHASLNLEDYKIFIEPKLMVRR